MRLVVWQLFIAREVIDVWARNVYEVGGISSHNTRQSGYDADDSAGRECWGSMPRIAAPTYKVVELLRSPVMLSRGIRIAVVGRICSSGQPPPAHFLHGHYKIKVEEREAEVLRSGGEETALMHRSGAAEAGRQSAVRMHAG